MGRLARSKRPCLGGLFRLSWLQTGGSYGTGVKKGGAPAVKARPGDDGVLLLAVASARTEVKRQVATEDKRRDLATVRLLGRENIMAAKGFALHVEPMFAAGCGDGNELLGGRIRAWLENSVSRPHSTTVELICSMLCLLFTKDFFHSVWSNYNVYSRVRVLKNGRSFWFAGNLFLSLLIPLVLGT